jgi:hypothetical protein
MTNLNRIIEGILFKLHEIEFSFIDIKGALILHRYCKNSLIRMNEMQVDMGRFLFLRFLSKLIQVSYYQNKIILETSYND